METHQQIVAFIGELPLVRSWPEMRDVARRAGAREPRDWKLPLVACESLGGSRSQAVPAAAAIACLQISIILVDDLLDEDPRGEHQRIGAPAAANLAVAFQAAGFEAIRQSQVTPVVKSEALLSLSQMALATALGQHWDAQNPRSEEEYWRLVQTKSAPFFGAALHVGALLAGASLEVAGQLARLGRLYGEMVQIHDDFNDTMAVPANPDWTLGRMPLPILFATLVEHPDRERFLGLRAAMPDPAALTEAQTILIRSGAVSYCIHQLLHRYQAARQLLAMIPLNERAGLDDLLAGQVKPVQELFTTLGMSLPRV